MSADSDLDPVLRWAALRLERLAAAGKCIDVAPALEAAAQHLRAVVGRLAEPGGRDARDVVPRLETIGRDIAGIGVPGDYLTVLEHLVARIVACARETAAVGSPAPTGTGATAEGAR